MTIEVPIKESFSPDAKILGWVTWLDEPILPSMYTLAAGYRLHSDGREEILEYAYVPDATYKIDRNT